MIFMPRRWTMSTKRRNPAGLTAVYLSLPNRRSESFQSSNTWINWMPCPLRRSSSASSYSPGSHGLRQGYSPRL